MPKENFIHNLGSFQKTFYCFLSILLLGIIDYLSGIELSFSIFYLLPVTFITWYGSRQQGIFFSVISSIVWLIVDLISKFSYTIMLTPFWNVCVRLGFFFIIVLLLDKLKTLNLYQEKIIQERTSEFKTSQQLYKSLVENMFEFFYIVDRECCLSYCSNNLLIKLGYSKDELIGENITRIIVPEDKNKILNIFKTPGSDQSSGKIYEFRVLCKDKSLIWVEQSSRGIFDDYGNVTQFHNLAHDISERKAAEEMLIESEKKILALFSPNYETSESSGIHVNSADIMNSLASKMNRLNEKIQNKMRQLISFSSLVSHELKTPLTIMKLQLESCFTPGAKISFVKKNILSVYDEILKTSSVVENLLQLATLEAGTLRLSTKKKELSKFLHEIYIELNLLCINKKQQLILNIYSKAWVNIDEIYIRQVFFNIIDNAIKFTPPKEKIVISLNKDDDSAIVAIKDSGIGIPGAEIQKIFDPFFKISPSKEPDHYSAGLGLMISKEIILLHGGSIDVNSTSGTGSEFIIRIPLTI